MATTVELARPLMVTHLRSCAKHRKPLPCPHCALPKPTVAVVQPPVAPVKSASSKRAAKWRAKQGADFAKREAQRKADSRDETDRQAEIADALKVNPTNAQNGPFVMREADRGKGLLVTGDGAATKAAENNERRSEKGSTKPRGWGSELFEKHDAAADDFPKEFEDTFAPKFSKPREVKALYAFIYGHTQREPMLQCLACPKVPGDDGVLRYRQIGPGDEDPEGAIAAGLAHFKEHHPKLYADFLARAKGTGCPIDHERLAKLFGGGDVPVKCKRCGKLIYKPPRKDPE
jgi:hypothetical protein